MSLLSRDRLHVALCLDRAVLLRFGGRRAAAREIVRCDPGDGWDNALAALRAALADSRWADAGVTVILSNHFVHYLLVPLDEKLATDEEQRAMVRHSFLRAHGDAADRWEFRWSEQATGAPSLASGVERALLDGLRAACKEAGLRLVSLQPYLMAACNHWRRELSGSASWFVLLEPGRMCLSRRARDAWLGVQSERIGGAWRDELPRILARETLLCGGADPAATLYLHVPEEPDASVALDGWAVRPLQLAPGPGFSPLADVGYAMAIAG